MNNKLADARDHERQVVELLACAEFLHGMLNGGEDFLGWSIHCCANGLYQALFAKFIADGVIRFCYTIGINHQYIVWAQSDSLRVALPLGKKADDGGGRGETLDGAVCAKDERGILSAICVG